MPAAELKVQEAGKEPRKGLVNRIGSVVSGGLRRVGDAVGSRVTGVADAAVGIVRNGTAKPRRASRW